VSNVAKVCAEPTAQHWIGVRRIMHYLYDTQDLGLLYTNDEIRECIGYSDSDWAGDLDDRKSTT